MRPFAIFWAGAENTVRVLHVINGLGLGGAEALLYRIVTRPSDIEHGVIVLEGRDWYSPLLEERGIAVEHLEMTSLQSSAKGLLRLNRLIRNSEADVVQTWMYRSNVLGGLYARAAGKPVVWGVHCSSLEALGTASRLVVYMSGALAPWIPDFIVNCSTGSEELHRRLGYQLAPGAVIHNGYDQATFRPDNTARGNSRRLLGISPDTFLVGSIGRWHLQKGIPILLRAWRMVSERGIPIHCVLVGRGLDADNSNLTALVAECGCADFVQPLGERSDIPDIARALDLHVLASIGSEAFPNVVGETMLSGTPNVVTDVGDSALIVGETGWVVPPRDPVQLATAIEQAWREWKDQPEGWATRGLTARRRIADNFTQDRMTAAYEQVWRKISARA